MKAKEKKQARELRENEGLPINEIAKRLNVSKSSVSLWVRDVELNNKQIENLRNMNPIYNNQLRGANKKREIYLSLRKEYQEIHFLISWLGFTTFKSSFPFPHIRKYI